MDPAQKLFSSSAPVELYSVKGPTRTKLKDGAPLEVFSKTSSQQYPMLSALLSVADACWTLCLGSHTMRSTSEAGEPTFIFSSVDDGDPELFFCVIFQRGHPAHELEVLEQILVKLSTFHVSKRAKKNQVPFNLPLPQLDPNMINEIMRKGAHDTQMLLKQAGDAANQMFLTAAEMHKKYAPKPSEQPLLVDPCVKDKIGKAKQATAAGAAVTQGVVTGLQAATVQVGTSLVQTVAQPTAAASGTGDNNTQEAVMPQPLRAVGGIGLELLRDIAAVRDAMMAAGSSAWQGARAATVDVMQYQYGPEVAAVTADGCDAVEGVASMGVAMRYTQPIQVVLSSAKEKSMQMEATAAAASRAQGQEQLVMQLQKEREALEKEKAALAAERAELSAIKQQRR